MSGILDSLLKVDLSRLSAEALEGLRTGTMKLSSSNGVVQRVTGGIVEYLPLVPVSPQELASAEQLLQVGQAVHGAKVAAVAATAVGTAVVVVAVVVATAYLAGKIEKVERSVKSVALTLEQQDHREYLRHISDYTGAIMAAAELLHSHASQSEISSQAAFRIDKLAESRHQLLLFIRNLPQSVASPEHTTQAQYDLALRFMAEMLDLIPSALVVERELCLVANKPGLAKSRSDHAAPQFRQALAEFRTWCEEQYQQLALGKGGFADILLARKKALNDLFNSPIHDLLLNGFDAAFAGQTTTTATERATEPASQVEASGFKTRV